MVSERYYFTKQKLEKGQIYFLTVNDPTRKDIGACAEFHTSDSTDSATKRPFLLVDTYLYDLFKAHKSIAFSIIIHELQHIYDYFHNQENFGINDLETYLYEMDALYTECIFIRDFLVPQNYQLTKFEKYLLLCINTNSLNTVSITYKGIDNSLIQKLYELEASKENFTETMDRFYQIVDYVRSSFVFPQNGNSWEQYKAIVPLNTICKFGSQIVRDVVCKKNDPSVCTGNFSLSKYPRAQKQLNEICALMKQYVKAFVFEDQIWEAVLEEFQ